MIYKPRAIFQVDTPKDSSRTDFIPLFPEIVALKWTRNNYLVADELTVTFDYRDSGVDPRLLRNARGALWLWDENFKHVDPQSCTYNPDDQGAPDVLRFTGICVKAVRKGSEDSMLVDLTFQDYTNFFINMKPLPIEGYPDYSDTLEEAWHKICDHTGAIVGTGKDKKILSSVTVLRNNLDVVPEHFRNVKIGRVVADRFHEVAKPTFPYRADAWGVWTYITVALGLFSYIDKDRCKVVASTEYFSPQEAASFMWGQNVLEFEESADPNISVKGVHLTSFDPLQGKVIEAWAPPPDDERIKKKKADVKRAVKTGVGIEPNQVATEYEPFECHWIHTQDALDDHAQMVYEQRKRQELEGHLTTREMSLTTQDGLDVSILDLTPGSAIKVEIDPHALDKITAIDNLEARIEYLMKVYGYNEDLAKLHAKNAEFSAHLVPFFHIGSIEVSLSAEKYDSEIKFHNLIILDDPPRGGPDRQATSFQDVKLGSPEAPLELDAPKGSFENPE